MSSTPPATAATICPYPESSFADIGCVGRTGEFCWRDAERAKGRKNRLGVNRAEQSLVLKDAAPAAGGQGIPRRTDADACKLRNIRRPQTVEVDVGCVDASSFAIAAYHPCRFSLVPGTGEEQGVGLQGFEHGA